METEVDPFSAFGTYPVLSSLIRFAIPLLGMILGNAMTGMRAQSLPAGTALEINGQHLERSRTFGDVAVGDATWYENANGLAEIAVNRGSAAERLGLEVGVPIRLVTLR